MHRLVFLVASLVILAPTALADIPSPEPTGKRTAVLVIAIVVAIGAALIAFARGARRRKSA